MQGLYDLVLHLLMVVRIYRPNDPNSKFAKDVMTDTLEELKRSVEIELNKIPKH